MPKVGSRATEDGGEAYLVPASSPRLSLRLETVKEGTVFGGTAEIRGDSSHGPICGIAPPCLLAYSLIHSLKSRVDDDGATNCAITEKQAG